MPPPLPRNPAEREGMWHYPQDQNYPMVLADYNEPADHLDAGTQSRMGLFPQMKKLLLSRFGYSRETDQHWFPVRPLGQGGFGGVAVWEKRDANGVVLEETAVKQSSWSRSMALTSDQRVAKEAAIMQQLNEEGSQNIVYLKGFKLFQDEMGRQSTWRFYFEYCPHGDLSRLQKRYKAWGTYFPEEFLWRVFHSMALVAQTMEKKEFSDLEKGRNNGPSSGGYMVVHADIKPLNIFLGYNTEPDSPWHPYPVVKVGDWGLAEVTNDSHPRNPRVFVGKGTPIYIPPESRSHEATAKYAGWATAPFDLDRDYKGEPGPDSTTADYTNRKVGSPHNVWAFGVTMYELLTHEQAKDLSRRLDQMTEFDYFEWDQQTIPNITTARQPEYSQELRDLVRWCLNLRPSLRPTVEQILDWTGTALQHYENRIAQSNSQANKDYELPRVYFSQNEISEMPVGPHLKHFDIDDWVQAEFVLDQDKQVAPVWGPLLHPRRTIWAQQYQYLKNSQIEREKARNHRSVSSEDPIATVKPVRKQAERRQTPAKLMQPAVPQLDGVTSGVNVRRRSQEQRKRRREQTFADQLDTVDALLLESRPRKWQKRLDTIDSLLLGSGRLPEEEESRRNVRARTRRLWRDQQGQSQGQDRVTGAEEEDVSMAGG